MITCQACAKQNQDHYRFCLGCGAELPRGGGASADSSPEITEEQTNTGASVAPDVTQASASEPPASAGQCPECDYDNPPTNRFCASCGFRLQDKPAAAVAVAAPVEAPAAAPGPELGSGIFLVALDPEGNELGRHELVQGESLIGRETGGLFEGDKFLSPQHARFVADNGRLAVEDKGSLNGVFKRMSPDVRSAMLSGQRFRIGQELLQVDTLTTPADEDEGVTVQGAEREGVVATVSLVVGRETRRPSFPIASRGVHMGRERGDLLFPEDGYVSGLHCRLEVDGGVVYVTDLGSSNGTFAQLLGEHEVGDGEILLMGQQLFRVQLAAAS